METPERSASTPCVILPDGRVVSPEHPEAPAAYIACGLTNPDDLMAICSLPRGHDGDHRYVSPTATTEEVL